MGIIKGEMAKLKDFGQSYMPFVKKLQSAQGMEAHTVYATYLRMKHCLDRFAMLYEGTTGGGLTAKAKQWAEIESHSTMHFFSQVRAFDPNQRAAVPRNDTYIPCLASSGTEATALVTELNQWWTEPIPENPGDVTTYWKALKDTHPQLYKYAKFILSAPGGTADIERNFSIVALVDSNRSPIMKTDLIEAPLAASVQQRSSAHQPASPSGANEAVEARQEARQGGD